MEELQREVAQLKIEVKNLRRIVDELGYMVVNHPLFFDLGSRRYRNFN